MINLYLSNNKVFVWNADDVYILRKEHRIVGFLVGGFPYKPFQTDNKWLPLQLMPEEVKLLMEKGIANLVSSPNGNSDPSLVKTFFEQRDKLCQEQISLYKEDRQKQILEKADEIFEGKKRKLIESKRNKKKSQLENRLSEAISHDSNNPEKQNESQHQGKKVEPHLKETKLSEKDESDTTMDSDVEFIDKEAVIQEELDRVPEINKEHCMVQLFVECPWKSVTTTDISWKYPVSDTEKLRYAVFKDLWEKKLYITQGTKFGGDFLAYEGDPLKYHALYIVVCILPTTKFQGIDILVYGRLGNQVKKTVALATVNNMGIVEYISLKWVPDIR